MCYLIAKKRNVSGCYAFKVSHGEMLSKLKKDLNDVALMNNIQLVTLSRPSAYGEYAPYSFVEDVNEFMLRVRQL